MVFLISTKSKILVLAAVCLIGLVCLTVFIFEKTNPDGFSKTVAFLSENGHTGLVNTPVKVAYESQSAKNYAMNGESQKQQEPSGQAGPAVAVAERPTQLFDIALEIDKTQIAKAGDLSARVIFASFGTVPTPVQMTFDVLDSSGNVVDSAVESTTVETEAVYNKKFSKVSFSGGNYTLRLTTIYNQDVKDQFFVPFSVYATAGQNISWLAIAIFAFFFFALLINIMLYIKKRLKMPGRQYG
jgi:hypothetical protein